jgi:broad specificity phosphatase PhoE
MSAAAAAASESQPPPLTLLVVSHGGTMAAIVRYLAAEQSCQFAPGQDHYKRLAKNTAISRFSFFVEKEKSVGKVRNLTCHELHTCDHLKGVEYIGDKNTEAC